MRVRGLTRLCFFYGFYPICFCCGDCGALFFQEEEEEFLGENNVCPQDVHIRVCPVYLCF